MVESKHKITPFAPTSSQLRQCFLSCKRAAHLTLPPWPAASLFTFTSVSPFSSFSGFNYSVVTKELKQLIELEGKAVGVGDHVGEKREDKEEGE